MQETITTVDMRHDLFIANLFKHAMNGGKAYAETYPDCKSGHDQAASRLLSSVKIQTKIALLQAEGTEKAEYGLATCIEELDEVKALATRLKQPSAAVSAIGLKAKITGLDKTGVLPEPPPPALTTEELDICREMAKAVTESRLSPARPLTATPVHELPVGHTTSPETEIMAGGALENGLPPSGAGEEKRTTLPEI